MISSTLVLIAFRCVRSISDAACSSACSMTCERAGGVGRQTERLREPPMRVELHRVAVLPRSLAVELDRRRGSCATASS